MDAFTRYVVRQSLTALLFVAIGLCIAVWLSQSLRLIELIVNRGVSVGTFLYLALLLLPRFLDVVLPIACFAAVLFVYHRLIGDSELVVIRAAGSSQWTLAKPAFVVATLVSAAGFALSLYFLPISYRAFKDLQFEIRNSYASVLLQEGVFNALTDSVMVYVRSRSADGELNGLMVHDERVADRPVTLTAERGALVQAADGPRIVMVNGSRQELERRTGRLAVLAFERYSIDIADVRDAPGSRWREPQERFLGELFFPTDSEVDRFYGHRLTVEGHQRIVTPLYAFAFVALALGALLSGEFNRRGQTTRVLAAVGAALVTQAGVIAINSLANRVPAAIPLMYLNLLLPFGIGLYLLGWHRPRRRAQPAYAG